LACGDLERGAALELVERFGPIHLAYVDPPWGSGNARSFRRAAGDPRAVDYPALLQALLAALRHAPQVAYVEMGNQWVALLTDLIAASDGTVLACWPITYYHRHPCSLLRITWQTGIPVLLADPAGLDDEETPVWAIQHETEAGDWVFDPCIGQGLTARAAHALGRRCLGMELNPRRLAVTIDRLCTHFGLTAHLIGHLAVMEPPHA
jgi:hypothetical protein